MFSDESEFEANLGKQMELKGKISKIIWQHMLIRVPDYPHTNYFDIISEGKDDSLQLVVYSKEPLPEDCILKITGELIKAEGKTKHLSEEKRKYYSEYQFIAKSFEIISSDSKK